MPWTSEQVLAHAPDAASAKAGQKQATPSVWTGLGSDGRALWGLCQGSGAKPYETAVDLGEPAFRCSCPSRKFPCKHALGLMLLWAANAGALADGAPPEWAASWLASRAERAERRSAPAEPQDPEKAAAQAAKRVATREARIADGLAELRLWLDDLVRQGFAHAEQRGRAEWEQMAARLVDAQAPGLARRVQELAWIVGSGPQWPARLLERAALLSLLADSYPRHDELPGPLRAELRTLVGWTTGSEELRESGERVTGTWRCVGQTFEADDRLQTRRTWLWGPGRWALLLDFAPTGRPLPAAPAPGRVVRGELAFYPAATPLRAHIVDAQDVDDDAPLPGAGSVAAAYEARAETLARSPWQDRLPVAVAGVPVREGDRWLLADDDLDAIALHPRSHKGMTIAALAGGRPVGVFGEWGQEGLWPLSAFSDGRVSPL